MNTPWSTGSVALTLVLVVQLAVLFWRGREPVPTRTEILSSDIRTVSVDLLTPGDRELASIVDGASCSLVVICATACSACSAMRGQWAEMVSTWAASVETTPGLAWLVHGGEAVPDFLSGYDLAGASIAAIPERPRGTLGFLTALGTPTTYLVDGNGRIRDYTVGIRLPSIEASISACGYSGER